MNSILYGRFLRTSNLFVVSRLIHVNFNSDMVAERLLIISHANAASGRCYVQLDARQSYRTQCLNLNLFSIHEEKLLVSLDLRISFYSEMS